MNKSIFKELLSLVSPEPSGRSLYHRIWELANDNIFDVEKLAGWKRWKHRFDRQIRTHDDAVRFANQALATLGDRFNQVYSQEQDRQLYALIHNPYAVTVKELPGKIGYFHLQDFLPWNTSDQVDRALCQLKNCKALVMDLRGNGGGDLEQALNCLGLFLQEGTLVTFKTRIPRGSYITRKLSLTADSLITVEGDPASGQSNAAATQRRTPSRATALVNRRLVVLVDQHTASAAEMFVAAMQDNGFTIIGSCTCGKGIGQRHFSLSEELGLSRHQEIALQVTNCRYYSPSGNWLGDDGQTVAAGIRPNIIVNPTQTDFERGSPEDNQLQAAVKLLGAQSQSSGERKTI